MSQISKPLHDKLINDFTNLHHDGDELCFGDVEKIFLDFPVSLPSCEIIRMEPTVDPIGLDYDVRSIGFRSIVYEQIEYNSSQQEADAKIDRLSDIEDVIMEYLEKIPNNIGTISGEKIHKIDIGPSRYDYVSAKSGMSIYQIIDFSLHILVEVKTL